MVMETFSLIIVFIEFFLPAYSHTAAIPLGGFKPDSVVLYRYGSDRTGWSEERSLRVPPRTPAMPGDAPLK